MARHAITRLEDYRRTEHNESWKDSRSSALQALTNSRTIAGASSIPRTRCGSMRFALHEVGMIKSSPNALLAEGTDWRFLNELKRELKA
jgi:hypothetical protein